MRNKHALEAGLTGELPLYVEEQREAFRNKLSYLSPGVVGYGWLRVLVLPPYRALFAISAK